MSINIRTIIFLLLILLSFAPDGAVHRADGGGPLETSAEEQQIYEAVQVYLEAEVNRDLKTVYNCLAPSSTYRASHDYEAYMAEAEASTVRIRKYKIIKITHIRMNEDKKRFPHVEKFAQIEVDLILFYTDIRQAAEVNFDFIFIKEGGRWYKG